MSAASSGAATALLVAQVPAAYSRPAGVGVDVAVAGSAAAAAAAAGVCGDAGLLGAVRALHVLRPAATDQGWVCACGWTPDPEGADLETQWRQHVPNGGTRG